MPLAVEGLSKGSSMQQIQTAISMSVRKLLKEGRDEKQAAAIAYDIARDKTGKALQRN